MGIAAATDEKVYVAGGDNGVGAAVFCSKNGGESFTSLPIDRAMMLMDVAFADENNGTLCSFSPCCSFQVFFFVLGKKISPIN